MEWTPIASLVAFGIAVAISAIVMFAKRAKLKTVRNVNTACDYTRAGSFNLATQRDTFLYRRITRVPRPQSNKK